jgi:hypothetical protein
MVQILNGIPEIPIGFIAFTDIIADTTQLHKGYIFHQGHVMQGCAFHRFNNGIEELAIPVDLLYRCTNLIDGYRRYFF